MGNAQGLHSRLKIAAVGAFFVGAAGATITAMPLIGAIFGAGGAAIICIAIRWSE
jgi:hypothetical protein